MKVSLHHCLLFASDLDKSVRFYQEMFGAKVIMDEEIAGARNVLISIGSGFVNFYDQPPKDKELFSLAAHRCQTHEEPDFPVLPVVVRSGLGY